MPRKADPHKNMKLITINVNYWELDGQPLDDVIAKLKEHAEGLTETTLYLGMDYDSLEVGVRGWRNKTPQELETAKRAAKIQQEQRARTKQATIDKEIATLKELATKYPEALNE